MMLSVEKLSVSFVDNDQRIPAVNNISFSIKQGETFCLVGESGSGKSVTALSILGLLPTNAELDIQSRIKFRTQEFHSEDLVRASGETMRSIRGTRISMIFQEPMTSLNPVLTIGEQLIEAIQLSTPDLGESEARQNALFALEEVKIDNPEQRFDQFPHRLSGGQRQRVMIAMAIACGPDLLIADEPTTALDVTVQAEILRLIKELQQLKKMSVLFITHDLGVVAQIADRVAVMHGGSIIEQGLCRSILLRPQHYYTRKLMDSLPENLPEVSSGSVIPDANTAGYNSLIKIENLHVQYPVRSGLFHRVSDYIKAVDGVDLTIDRGQIVALVGESGCGKTTLGRAVLKLVDSDSGRILFLKENILEANAQRWKQLRPKLQYIFQDPASSLNPRLTVATALIEPMAVHGIGESYEHRVQLAANLLEDVQLHSQYLWRFPHQLSGGQRQRIGIARALSVNPNFIVCDEITSALDVSVQAGVLSLLLSLRETRNLALLFITHDIGVVEYISDKTAVMHQGKIVEIGDTKQVCNQPESPYTKQLINAVPRVSSVA